MGVEIQKPGMEKQPGGVVRVSGKNTTEWGQKKEQGGGLFQSPLVRHG